MTFYAYIWMRSTNTNGWPIGSSYYIGKGCKDRAFVQYDHKVKVPTDISLIQVIDCLDEESAFETEKFLISYYGRIDLGTGCLRNLTPGGDKPPNASGNEACRQASIRNGLRNVQSGHLQSISSAGGKVAGKLVGARNRDSGWMKKVQQMGLGKGGKIGGPKGMHTRWHVNRGITSVDCKHCNVG